MLKLYFILAAVHIVSLVDRNPLDDHHSPAAFPSQKNFRDIRAVHFGSLTWSRGFSACHGPFSS